MKSLQIVGNSCFGGATRLMLEWSKYLLERAVQVDILCTDERMQEEVNQIGDVGLVDHIFIPKEIDPVADVRALGQLVTLCRQNRYDVVHTYTATPSFLGRLAATVSRVPVVVNHQGGWAVNETSSLIERVVYTPLEFLATAACTKNICVSHAELEKARINRLAPLRKLVTIVNGIDPTPFVDAALTKRKRQKLRKQLKLSEETILVGNTGRLVSGKGNDTLITAMSHLRQRLPNNPIALALAGDGADRDALTKLIKEHDLTDSVHLLGFYADIPGFLAGIDIFVTPTLTEGLSISLLEAMAAARSVIATSIPANAEVVDHGKTGLLVPINSPEQIAAAIELFIQEPGFAKDCATAAQQRILDYYTQDRMFQETWDLYNELLENHGRRQSKESTRASLEKADRWRTT